MRAFWKLTFQTLSSAISSKEAETVLNISAFFAAFKQHCPNKDTARPLLIYERGLMECSTVNVKSFQHKVFIKTNNILKKPQLCIFNIIKRFLL